MLFSPVKYVLYFYISTFPTTYAVSNMAAFCSFLISCFPGMLIRYCLSEFEMVPVASVIAGIAYALTFHMRWISIMRSIYRVIHKSVKHFKNSQQVDYSTDHNISYVDRERNSPKFF